MCPNSSGSLSIKYSPPVGQGWAIQRAVNSLLSARVVLVVKNCFSPTRRTTRSSNASAILTAALVRSGNNHLEPESVSLVSLRPLPQCYRSALGDRWIQRVELNGMLNWIERIEFLDE